MTTFASTQPEFAWAVAPGRIIQRELDASELSQAQLAARTGLSTKHVNLMIKGTAPLSPDVAVALEQVLGPRAETWLRLEGRYRAQLARATRRESLAAHVDWVKNFPMSVLVHKGILTNDDSPPVIVEKLLAFFGVASTDGFEKAWLEPQASYKRSQLHEVDGYATAVWMRLAEVDAGLVGADAPPFDAAILRDAVGEIPSLTMLEIGEGFRRAQDLLLAAGVVLVFTPEVPGTRICGASRWVNRRPVIAMTNRYKYLDSFWFTMLHEIAHVLLHPKRGTYIDYAGKASDNSDSKETAANEFAELLLVPKRRRNAVVAASTVEEVRSLANELGVSPGTIAAQRAFLTGVWSGPIAKLRERVDIEQALAKS